MSYLAFIMNGSQEVARISNIKKWWDSLTFAEQLDQLPRPESCDGLRLRRSTEP
jgi:hypothetical protein